MSRRWAATNLAANICEAQNNVDKGEDDNDNCHIHPDGLVITEGEVHGDEDDVYETLDRLDQDGSAHGSGTECVQRSGDDKQVGVAEINLLQKCLVCSLRSAVILGVFKLHSRDYRHEQTADHIEQEYSNEHPK